MKSLVFERIEVGGSTVDATLRLDRNELMRTSVDPGVPDRALELLPGLARHRCENDVGLRFVDELRDTETAHLLEHVAVEIMALAGSPRTLKARTDWDFAREGHGVFHIRIEYDDDLVAIGALKEALTVVLWLLGEEGDKPDVDAVVCRLAALRRV